MIIATADRIALETVGVIGMDEAAHPNVIVEENVLNVTVKKVALETAVVQELMADVIVVVIVTENVLNKKEKQFYFSMIL